MKYCLKLKLVVSYPTPFVSFTAFHNIHDSKQHYYFREVGSRIQVTKFLISLGNNTLKQYKSVHDLDM